MLQDSGFYVKMTVHDISIIKEFLRNEKNLIRLPRQYLPVNNG